MARLSKKILKKIQPKETKPKEKPEKVGKDYLLIIILSLTIVFTLVGWPYFDNINRGLYVALTLALLTTYIRRHAKLSEKQNYWMEKASQVSIGAAIALFAVLAYYQHFSD